MSGAARTGLSRSTRPRPLARSYLAAAPWPASGPAKQQHRGSMHAPFCATGNAEGHGETWMREVGGGARLALFFPLWRDTKVDSSRSANRKKTPQVIFPISFFRWF